jgi:hypothetical protein
MMRRNNADNWSIWNENGMLKFSKLMKSKYFITPALSPDACDEIKPDDFTSRNIIMLIQKETSITPEPIEPIADLDSCFLNNPLIRKPINGNKGINHARSSVLFIV